MKRILRQQIGLCTNLYQPDHLVAVAAIHEANTDRTPHPDDVQLGLKYVE